MRCVLKHYGKDTKHYQRIPQSNPACRLLSSVSAACGKSYGTNGERVIYQSKAWSLAAKHQEAAVFVTLTPNENGNATIAFFAREITQKSLYQVQHVGVSGSPCVATQLFDFFIVCYSAPTDRGLFILPL